MLAVTYSLNAFKLFIVNKNEITVRTDCEAIVKSFNKKNEKKSSTKRWLNFVDRIIGNGYKINFEYTKSSDNSLADCLSWLTSSYVKDGSIQ